MHCLASITFVKAWIALVGRAHVVVAKSTNNVRNHHPGARGHQLQSFMNPEIAESAVSTGISVLRRSSRYAPKISSTAISLSTRATQSRPRYAPFGQALLSMVSGSTACLPHHFVSESIMTVPYPVAEGTLSLRHNSLSSLHVCTPLLQSIHPNNLPRSDSNTCKSNASCAFRLQAVALEKGLRTSAILRPS